MHKRPQPAADSSIRDDHRRIFMERVHRLLFLAYGRMLPAKKWAHHKEEDISGELARHIDEVLDSLSQPWMKFYSLEAERHVDEPHLPLAKRRLGKHRRRLDIRFRCRQRSPILRFIYEAKLLTDTGSYQDLLGDSGLSRFLDKRYARSDNAAGLIGYVQIGEEAEHADRVRADLEKRSHSCRLVQNSSWTECRWPGCVFRSHVTQHHRDRLPDILIFHTFLRFH